MLRSQGLALHGQVVERNLEQLIQTWAADHHYMRSFVKEKKYLSPMVINEIISLFGKKYCALY